MARVARKETSGARVLLLAVMLVYAAAARAGDGVTPRIVNGVLTDGFSSVGLLVGVPGRDALCSGTMIGCETFLTAAHCVCPEGADTAQSCLEQGLTDPADLLVFLANAGTLAVRSIEIDPSYEFEVGGDLAVLKLTTAMDGVSPSPLNAQAKPLPATAGVIVGYGRTGGDNQVYGIKRAGSVVLQGCRTVPAATNVCFPFSEPLGPPGEDSNTCNGDSGGPLFVGSGAPPLLAGVTSGGLPTSCLAQPDGESWDTDVFSHLAFIRRAGGSDVGKTTCGALPQVGAAGTAVVADAGTLDRESPTFEGDFEVPAGTAMLRVTMNHQDKDGEASNDFDLYVKRGAPPTREDYDCRDYGKIPVAACQFATPAAATWFVLVDRFEGAGEFQVAATTFAGKVCVGDCSGVGKVSIDDLVKMVNIALGLLPVSECPAGDPNHHGTITIDDIIQAVRNAQEGCPA